MKNYLLIIGTLVLVCLILAIVKRNDLMAGDTFKNRRLLSIGDNYPVIWLYYNSSQVNSRKWSDFMARSSRVLNEPFLNLCYNSIVKHNKDYRVEVIGGIEDLAVRLGGWEELPEPMRNPLIDIGEREMNWIRAAVLRKFGGLWLSPSAISVNGFGKLAGDKIVGFGNGSVGALWVPKVEMPELVAWEEAARKRVDTYSSNSEFRHDELWDWNTFCNKTSLRNKDAELNKKRDGHKIELEDLLMAGQEGDMTFNITKNSVYVSIPYRELQRRSMYGWFLRMSEEQIMESDLVVRDLFLL